MNELKRANLRPDPEDPNCSRMIDTDGSIWPAEDTGYRRK